MAGPPDDQVLRLAVIGRVALAVDPDVFDGLVEVRKGWNRRELVDTRITVRTEGK